ncbi:MAG: NAD(P)-dependent oxidoreductase [Gammaproteobacteria bacterium]|nr:NAD(P)-dependent oxidoreductase [Gammaproteobacteria bacterium]MDH3412728.1 NAD(P)-dependent oxidoreductase [Gammaproteobacteria bacterium]
MKLGIAGTGKMGAAIAQRLMGLGHEVTVWNRTADKTKGLAAAGAKVATTPAALAAGSEAVITILTDAAAIEAVYNGPQGLLSGNVTSKLFIEMSTVRPEAEVALGPKVKQKGATLVECPVGGTVGPARDGKLFGFAGGETADVARAKPLLDQMCRRVEHVGPIGAGTRMKLAINLPLMVFWQSFGEALALCAPLGLDPNRVVEIFADSSGGPNLLKGRGAVIAKVLKGEDAGATMFDVDSMRKDLRSMIDEAKALGSGAPVSERALECFDEASKEGLGAADMAALPARWMRRAART